jgi:hypothetical protein
MAVAGGVTTLLTGPRELQLIPFPHEISYRGAPWRAPPSLFFHLPAEAYQAVRPRAQALAQQLTAVGVRTQLASTPLLTGYQAALSSSPSFSPHWNSLLKPTRGLCGKVEGYRLLVTEEGAFLQANEEQGFYYGGQTLRQLLEGSRELPGMTIEDGPVLPLRAMHLDLRGWPPTPEYLRETIERLSQYKFNLVILEYERYFAYSSQPGMPAPEALSPGFINELNLFARDRAVRLVPLCHCLGNTGHLLRLAPYKEIREDPRYFQQFCPSHPASLEVFTAMAEELLAVHPGPFFHVGGDGARLLGCCPNCQARMRKLGGRSALYLDYISKVAEFLIARQKSVLLWDEVVRGTTDEQVRWLPSEVSFVLCNYSGQGGRATEEILVPLDRYKKLGRRAWGAACRLPSERYAALDNLDAWAEAAELGYIEGLITTTWTRDGSLGTLLAPPEIAWPAALYAAERSWGGRSHATREEFFRRFGGCLFGAQDRSDQDRLWAVFDLMLRGHPREAREYLYQVLERCTRGKATLSFVDSWCAVSALLLYAGRFQEAVAANYRNLRNGDGEPFQAGRLRFRIEDLRSKAPDLVRFFRERATRISPPSSAEEYLSNQFAYSLARLEELSVLLASYPLPDREWQQPVRV